MKIYKTNKQKVLKKGKINTPKSEQINNKQINRPKGAHTAFPLTREPGFSLPLTSTHQQNPVES